MGNIHQEFRITLDLEYHTDPVVECLIEGASIEELITNAKTYAG